MKLSDTKCKNAKPFEPPRKTPKKLADGGGLYLWVMPAERMKMGKEHIVPLSKQAIKILQNQKLLAGHWLLVFPSNVKPQKSIRRGNTSCALSATVSKAHKIKQLSSPVSSEIVKLTLRGIERTHVTSIKQATALTRDDLISLFSNISDNVKGVRDKAILLIGFAGALRRSEIVSLNIADITHDKQGINLIKLYCVISVMQDYLKIVL